MRENNWLEEQLQYLLNKYFANVTITNPIVIQFGREAKYRFGSIKLLKKRRRGIRSLLNGKDEEPQKSIITITKMFARDDIPVEVVQYTICHELCHYTHGFSSANRRLFKYPHHGGIINKELTARGAEELIPHFKKWLKEYRSAILQKRVDG